MIIPTWNRRTLLPLAIDSVLAQTHPAGEIIVVDDGSTDGTADMLAERYGDRVRVIRQDNAGVSAARNRGLAAARGRFLALLDSDDEWMPDKLRLQREWLDAHPDHGMVLTDVVRMDGERRDFEVFHRREVIREDGWILRWILHDPALVPSSVLMRREVFDAVGGFDTTLRTAEDLEWHLRVARRFRIGLIATPLVRAMRGHDGLSALACSNDDYVRVMERAAAEAVGEVPEPERRRALAGAYLRNARGMLIDHRWRDGWRLARRAFATAPGWRLRADVLALAPFAARRWLRRLRPA